MTSKAKRDMIRHWAERGYDIPTTAEILGMSIDEVRDVLTHPDPITPPQPKYGPEFLEPPSFNGLN